MGVKVSRSNGSSGSGFWTVAWVVAVLLIGSALFEQGASYIDTRQGEGFPLAQVVNHGEKQPAKPSINDVASGWDQCGHKNLGYDCKTAGVQDTPLVYWVKDLHLDKGCFDAKPKTPAYRLLAASTKDGGSYTVEYSKDKAVLELCVDGDPGKNDVIVIWSDNLVKK